MWDVIIVGAGVAGLSTGAILAREGLRTLVVERAFMVGGRGKCFEYKKGYLVDYGIHALRMADEGAAASVFRKLGESLEVVEPEESGLYHQGEWSELPLSVNAITSSPLFSKEDLDELMKGLTELLGAKPEEYWDVPLKDWAEGAFKSENVRWFIQELLAKLLLIAVDMSETSTGEFFDLVQAFVKSGKGAGYVVGGWKTITDRLTEIIEENGEVRTKAKVDGVLVKEGRVKGVSIRGEKLVADTVVAAIPVQHLFSVVDRNLFPDDYAEKLSSMKPTMGVSIDYGLSGRISEYDTFMCSDPWMTGATTSNMDPSVAPRGEQLLTVFSVLPSDVVLDKERAKAEISRIEEKLGEMFPKFKGSVRWRRPLILRMVDGAALTVTQSQDKRPSPETPLKGLYLASDTCNGRGAGGDIAYNSAMKCAEVILKSR